MNDPNRVLTKAARAGDWKRVQAALDAGADLGAPADPQRPDDVLGAPLGVEALATAIRAAGKRDLTDDDLQTVRVLLDAGVPVNQRRYPVRDSYPLHLAANGGHEALVRLLLERGATFWLRGLEGASLIRWPAYYGFTWFVAEFLGRLRASGYIFARQREPSRFLRLVLPIAMVCEPVGEGLQAALSGAARWGHDDIVELLLDFGVPIEAPPGKESALLNAAAWGHHSTVKLLRARGAHLGASGERGNTLLIAATQGGLNELAMEVLPRSNVNATDSRGTTALHNAAAHCDEALTRALVERGARVRAHTETNRTVLHLAAWGGNVWLINECLRAGENVNATDRWGNTPLMEAAGQGQLAAMRLLVARGAPVNHVGRYLGETALHSAIGGRHGEAARWLVEQGADIEAQVDHLELASLTPLMNAASSGQFAIVSLLRGRGAQLEIEGEGSALHLAAISDSVETVELLLSLGAEVDARDDDGETPLLCAIAAGQAAIVEYLLKAGADVNARGFGEQGALHQAITNDQPELVPTLLREGADAFALNDKNQTPLDLAIANDCDRAIRALGV